MKKALIFIVLILLVGTGSVGAYYLLHRNQAAKSSEANGSKIDLSPGTAQDKEFSDSHKDTSDQKTRDVNGETPTSTGGANVVTPIITTSGQDNTQLIVNGFVSGVVEDGGTCTITLVRSGATVSRSRQGVANATNTSCGRTDIPLSELSPGTWKATLSYRSSTSHGTSVAKNIEVTTQ